MLQHYYCNCTGCNALLAHFIIWPFQVQVVHPCKHDAKHFFFVYYITSSMAAEAASVLQRFEEGIMSTQGGGWRGGASSCQRESNSHLNTGSSISSHQLNQKL